MNEYLNRCLELLEASDVIRAVTPPLTERGSERWLDVGDGYLLSLENLGGPVLVPRRVWSHQSGEVPFDMLAEEMFERVCSGRGGIFKRWLWYVAEGGVQACSYAEFISDPVSSGMLRRL